MYTYTLRSRTEIQELLQSAIFGERYQLERHICLRAGSEPIITLPGYCVVCQKPTDFRSNREQGGLQADEAWFPNWREQQICPGCELNSRQRIGFAFVRMVLARSKTPRPTLYLKEQVTPLYRACREKLTDVEVIGSEYLAPEDRETSEVRHEDAHALSFAENTLDLVASNDVLEHVYDPFQAFREMCRVLKPGGQFFFTVPFFHLRDANTVRATVTDQGITHLLPPDYHENPLDDEGSLVFTEFSWEIIDQLRRAGFEDPAATLFWSQTYGHFGIPSLFFHGAKK